MAFCTQFKEGLMDLGLVLIEFDLTIGPLIVFNHSCLNEEELQELSLKGISTLLNGHVTYSSSHKFRGLLQLTKDYFVYGFDLSIQDIENKEIKQIPAMLFIIFPAFSLPVIAGNIKSLEKILMESTEYLEYASITPEYGFNLLSLLHDSIM